MSRCRDPTQRGTGLVDKLVRDNLNIIGVKDTIDSLAHNRSLIQAVGDRIAIFSGFDEYYIPNRIAGGAEVISGLTNIVPEVFVDMHESFERGDIAHACASATKIPGSCGSTLLATTSSTRSRPLSAYGRARSFTPAPASHTYRSPAMMWNGPARSSLRRCPKT